jgi:hypothetical protein
MCQDTNFERKENKNGSRGMFFAVAEIYIYILFLFFAGGGMCTQFVKIEAEKKALFSHVFSLIISYFRRK